MADHYGNHRLRELNNVATAFILPNRWYNGAESLGRSIGRYTTCGLYLDSQEETAIN